MILRGNGIWKIQFMNGEAYGEVMVKWTIAWAECWYERIPWKLVENKFGALSQLYIVSKAVDTEYSQVEVHKEEHNLSQEPLQTH